MGESRPIKVMHIIARMNVGGPAVEIVELMRGLDPQVVSQRLVTGYCDDDEADYLETQAPDIPATRIEGLGRSIRPTDDAKAFTQLIKLIRISRPDIVHTHTAKAGVLGRLAAKLSGTGTKVIHTYHGHLLYGYFSPTKTKAWIQVEKRLATITDFLITVGNAVQGDLLTSGIGVKSQYEAIHSGARSRPMPDRLDARRVLGLEMNQVGVSMISRVSQVKRPDRFLDVVRLVSGVRSDVRFLLAGGGEQAASVQEAVMNEGLPVVSLGWRDDIDMIIAATDVLLLTSDNEGIPLSLIEGAVGGVPAVATDVGGVSEIVQDGMTGILCQTNARSLADALLYLADNPDVRAAMGHEARSYVAHAFSQEAFLGSHLRTYERCAAAQTFDRAQEPPNSPELSSPPNSVNGAP